MPGERKPDTSFEIKAPLVMPSFLKTVREKAERSGSVSAAVAEVFERANINVEVLGGDHVLDDPEIGTMLLGDHRNRIEKWPLMAWVGRVAEKDPHFMSKPFSLQARLLHGIGGAATELTLPVVPRSMARDRKAGLSRDTYWRVKNHNSLPTLAEIKEGNRAALGRTAMVLAVGGLVSMFPTGSTADALESPWQRGVGTVAQLLPEESHENVHTLPFRFDDFSKNALVKALWLREYGLKPKEQTITLNIGESTPISSTLERLRVEHGNDIESQNISAALQTDYIEQLGSDDPLAPPSVAS